MKSFLSALLLLALTACAADQMAGTGIINGKPSEFKVRGYTENGLVLEGWMLIVDGEELGILRFDGQRTGRFSRQKIDYVPLNTKYGVFDAVQEVNVNIDAVTDTFTISLNGEYVATIYGRN